ncbi:MAG TPA: NYN domain-containing protein [Gemmatimonadaceae bacterium]|nr:NYN domain-containing protein [Gemmatimonadaceae bacterium]
MSHHNTGSHTIQHAPNAALLIDFDNVTMGIRSDLQTELKNLLASDIIKGKVSVQRAYADWRRYPQYIVPLAESSIDMIMAPAYGSAKKNATDIRLAIDALELVFVRPEIGTFILLSGDSDFSSLVIKLKEYGKYVIGVGIRESSSDLLVMNCDEYYSYNALAGLKKEGEEEVVKQDPWELVAEAVQKMKRNGDVMRADRLKQVMQQMDSSFDEKNVGKAKFSLFVSEAAKRGLLSLTKLENGQLEVDVPKPTAAQPLTEDGPVAAPRAAPTPAVSTADTEESDRARRGRRGGRGRQRDRDDRPPRDSQSPLAVVAESPEVSSSSPAPMGTDAMDPQIPRVDRAVPTDATAPTTHRRAPAAADEIGSSGLRLTRDEAFDLVRRAVATVATGGAAIAAAKVRAAARSLLGRDSESLSERNFVRILHDAHDADVVDLRRRGSDYEVAAAVASAPVDRQLEAAASANAAPVKPVIPAMRGMGARGIGRGSMGARPAPPAHLLSVGVVASRTAKPAPVTATEAAASLVGSSEVPSVETTAASDGASAAAPAQRAGRKGSAAKKATRAPRAPRAPRAAASGSSADGAAPVAKPKRASRARKKTAVKSPAGSDS